MKWFAGTIAGVFLGLLGLCLFLAIKAGAFLPVQISTEQTQKLGPYLFLYKEVVGPYHKVSEDLFEVEDFAKKKGLICPMTMGHYLDDPRAMDHDRLRSHMGCLFPSSLLSKEKLNEILAQKPSYKSQEIIFSKYIQGQFQGSPALVAFKVYPKLRDFARKQRLKLTSDVYEIYQAQGAHKMKTQVIFQIED